MQERPNKLALLAAIARFLVEDVRPALSDPRLNFRALIAAHLASVVAAELTSDEESVGRDLARLRRFFPESAASPAPGDALSARRALVADLNARLATELREGTPAREPGELAAIAAALRESLREKLAIENPRFDTSPAIE
jgi:Domain of unknown function (DUF6285)